MEQSYLEQGSILDGRYRIISMKRKSETGFLYNAINILTGNAVEIKEYFPSSCIRENNQEIRAVKGMGTLTFEMLKKRFLREARILKDYRDLPGIVGILDYFEVNGTVYCVLEKREGILLADRLKGMPNKRMNPKSAFQGMIPILQSLAKIHEAGFLIRMIRPDNIEVSKDNQFSICDFGVPKEFETVRQQEDKKEDSLHIEANATKLTVFEADAFTAPERMDTETKQGPWSDLYSVTAVLYLCITGQEPERAYEQILGEQLPSPSELGIQIDEKAERVLMKGLAIKAEERYRNADEMLADICRIYPKENTVNKKKRWKKMIMIVAAVAGATLFGAVLFFYFHPAILKFHGIETETIWLEPAKNADKKTVKQDWEIIRQRVKVFAGERGYIWQKKGKNVLLILPESLFEEQGSRSSIQDYLLDPWDLYSARKNASIEKVEEKKAGIMPGYKEYLTYHKVLTNDKRPIELPEKGRYLRVKVTPRIRKMMENIIEKFQDSIQHPGADPTKAAEKLIDSRTTWLVRDTNLWSENQAYAEKLYLGLETNVLVVHLDENINYLDVTGEMQSGPFFRLMTYNLTHNGPRNKFYAYAEQKIKWEIPGRGTVKGKYQKKAEYPIHKPVYLAYLNVYSGKIDQKSAGEWGRKITDFKEMLDVLKTPYAIGISKDNNREIFVKIDRTKIPEFYAETLDGGTCDLGCGWSYLNEGHRYEVRAIRRIGGKRSIHVKISDDVSDYKLDRLKEKVEIAKKNDVKEIRLLVGGTEVAEGKLAKQKDLKKGMLVFDRLVLPNSKEKNIGRISRCINKLNHVKNYLGSSYSLIGTQKIGGNGLPIPDRSSSPMGGSQFLSKDEKKKIEKSAGKNGVKVSIVEKLSCHTLTFSNYTQLRSSEEKDKLPDSISESGQDETKKEGKERNFKSNEAFINDSLDTVMELIKSSVNETRIKDIFWDYVSVDLYSSNHKVRIQATLEPKNKILYEYNDLEKKENEKCDLGKIAIYGRIYELGDSSSLEDLKWMSLKEKANLAENSDAITAKRYIDQSNFFQKYGGSDTWEYGMR